MEIVKFPHKSLFTKTDQVTYFGPELKVTLDSMYLTMIANEGVGLAANQVGLTNRMFVMQVDDKPLFLVNPKIVWESREIAKIKEGCLSAPGEFVVLARSSIVKVEFQDETGENKFKIFNDLLAICAQHEIDHLDGKSFLEHKSLVKSVRKSFQSKWGIKK